MTDEEFAEFCSEHPDLFFEMSAEGELIVMPTPYSLTGIRQGEIYAQLNRWAEEDGRGIAGEANTAFVIEVRPPTDRLRTLRAKMREWVDNSAALAWMIDPENRTVEIYRPGVEMEMLTNPESLQGEDPVQGFVSHLVPVWDPLGSQARSHRLLRMVTTVMSSFCPHARAASAI